MVSFPACCAIGNAPLSEVDAERLAGKLKAVADPARLRLLSMIANSPDAEACVCHLIGPLGLRQPRTSHHLKVLHDAGLLTREKRGVWVYYRVVSSAVADLGALLGGVAR